MRDLTARPGWPQQTTLNASIRSDRKSPRILLAVLLLMLATSALPALANTVNMQFTGTPTGNNYAGILSYPYDIKVNGGVNQWMMCISYHEHISTGETWKATVVSVGSLDPSTHLLDYEAAFLFKMALADHGANPAINAAAWWLLEGAPSLNGPAHNLELMAQNQTYYKGEYSDVLLYTPIPGTQSGTLGTPQTFLGNTPEPGTLGLLGTGVLGLGGFLRRRLRS